MIYIIIAILLIIIILITGLIFRKRMYDEVDRQESWKLDIMNRNVAGQIARIKKLNLSGETQEKFEEWKERWETIVTKDLSDVEEALFEAEEASDRYRFPTAKKVIENTDERLQSVEKDIENILVELDQLIDTEKENREEIEQMEPTLKKLQKVISQKRYQYGKADQWFEKELKQSEDGIATYHELVQSGNYLEAKELVDGLKEALATVEKKLEEFPDLYKACKDQLPSELNELLAGVQEMIEDGYPIKQFNFEEEIKQSQKRLHDGVLALEKGEIDESRQMISEIDERIKEIYDVLEKEAIAKNYVESHVPSYQKALEEVAATFSETKTEVDYLKQTYYLDDGDMEKYMSIEKTIDHLQAQYEKISNALENEKGTYIEMRERLEKEWQQLEEIKEEHIAFKKDLQNLRRDELEAKEELLQMRQKSQDTYRKLAKSNIPGIPNFILDILEDTKEKNDYVLHVLEKQPLDMTEVQKALGEAKTATEYLLEQTNFMLDQAYLTEQVIQYANRYRSRYPILAGKLAEAEQLFRKYEYEAALEEAAKAVEEVEPGALKRIEELQSIV